MAKKQKTKGNMKKAGKKSKRTAKQPKAQSAFAKIGRAFDQSKALVVLRKGNAIDQAKILDKKFSITTDELGALNIPTNQIFTIIMKNDPQFPLDVIRLNHGNEISGTITTDPVHAKSPEVGGNITIALAEILYIIF